MSLNLDRADDVGEISEPGMHPDDPEGMDHWRLGYCDHCSGSVAILVHPSPCGAPDCTGCLSICLPCESAVLR